MKNFILLLLLFSFTIVSSAQDLQISFNVSTYQGGSNISCNGAADGWINVMILGGVQPYFFHWSNGSYVQNLTGLTAGNYTIIVTDANNLTASQMIFHIPLLCFATNRLQTKKSRLTPLKTKVLNFLILYSFVQPWHLQHLQFAAIEYTTQTLYLLR